jgi:pilus assembly protein Flp/PilA
VGEEIVARGLDVRVGERREGHMLDSMQTWLAREDGQALIEYALILSLVAIVTFGALSLIGTNVIDILNGAAGSL